MKKPKPGEYSSDNPEIFEGEESSQSLEELIEMVEQKLPHIPKSEILYDKWRGELNNLIREINFRAGKKLYKNV